MNKNFNQYHEDFMAESRYSKRFSPATLRGYQAAFELLCSVMPGIALDSITDTTLKAFFRELETRERVVGRGRIKKGVKTSTIATYRAKLSPFFAWLVKSGHIKASPFGGFTPLRVSYNEPKYLRQEQVERIMTAITAKISWASLFIQKRNYAIIATLLYAGLRKTELLSLKIHDIDLERKTLHVNGSTSKSGDSRIVPINLSLYRALEDYFQERKKKGYGTSYLFVSDTRDDGLTDDGFKHLIEKLTRESGIKFHAHQLRHTFAVNVIQNGNLPAAQQLMGHKTVLSTMVYLRALPDDIKRQHVESLQLQDMI
jgi:site-specific recombinase XerD